MLLKVLHAIAVAIIVYLACLLVALILASLGNVPLAEAVAKFLNQWAYVIGVLFGIFDFVGGGFGPKFGGAA